MNVTRLGLYGGGRPPYGSFSKISQTKSYTGETTRLALYGGARFPYGSFAGKVTTEEEERKKGAGVLRHRPIIHVIHKKIEEDQPVTAFSRAFEKAAQTVSREEKRQVLAERVESENLQGLGKIGKLNDDEVALILLLLD